MLDIGRYLGVDTSSIAAWRPTPDELARIRFCLDLGHVSAAAEALHRRNDSIFVLNVAPGQRGRVNAGAADYGLLVSQLEAFARVDHESFDAIAFQAACRRLEEVVECDLVGPLLERAMETNDPLVRNLLVTSGSLAKWLHCHAPFLGGALAPPTDAGARRVVTRHSPTLPCF